MSGKRDRFSMSDMLKAKTPLLQTGARVPLEQLEEKFLGARESGEPAAPSASPPSVSQPDYTTVETTRIVESNAERIAERITEQHTPVVQLPDRATRLKPRSERKPINIPWSFRMPIQLYERMDRVARRLDINKTDIVLECLELCLPTLEQMPPRNPDASD